MERALTVVFWGCFAAIVWVYFGYPVTLVLGLFGRPKRHSRRRIAPTISVIVPAHNEEFGIEAKLLNLMACDYPREQVEIFVGSDGSSDRTQEIVERFAGGDVNLISFPQQRGKSAIQNGLAAAASGSILVFTDADCLLPHDALRNLVEHFADPRVGLVTARPVYLNASESSTALNESLYLRHETWLRRLESERGLLAMASGSLFALRRSLWQPLDPNLGDDFVLPLRVAREGLRNIMDPRIAAVTRLTQNHPRALLRLKARVISKDFRALRAYRSLLNPIVHGRISLALWSHKLMRWFIPYFLLGAFASSLGIVGRPVPRAALIAQSLFYAAAIAGFLSRKRRFRFFGSRLCSIPMSFCVVNCAALLGTLKCLAGRASGIWEPERSSSAVTTPASSTFKPSIPVD